jgi:hypothetical protein
VIVSGGVEKDEDVAPETGEAVSPLVPMYH